MKTNLKSMKTNINRTETGDSNYILDHSWNDKFEFKIKPKEWHENFGMSGLSVSSQLAFIMVMHALMSWFKSF